MRYAQGGGGPLGARKYDIVQHTRGKVLEIGRGSFKVWPHFVAVRERSDATVTPGDSADYWVDSFTDLRDFKSDSFDAIVCHSGCTIDDDEALRLLKDGGWHIGGSADALSRSQKIGDELCQTVSFWPPAFVRQLADGSWEDLPTPKTVCVVRYGAIGDALQAASILPELKRQGYHVTLMCEPLGEEMLRHDPHIDEFLVQDKDQVPNQELPSYWAHVAKRFDRFINLCESIEGTLIKLPGRADFSFPHALRHELCNHNYLEFMAKLAELPFHPEHHFYETDAERQRARDLIDEIGRQTNPNWIVGAKWQRPYVVMWVLSGSGVHKFYPHQDAIIARLMLEIPHAHVITVGDHACEILEVGWENEPRVHRRSGQLSIRDTIALAQQCDLVIGPETGVLNAVAFESCAKIVFLSHSSHENLTKHWTNTEALEPADTKCYPCHQLHYGMKHCWQHAESGAAMCQWNIEPGRAWEAVQRAFIGSATVRQLLEIPA